MKKPNRRFVTNLCTYLMVIIAFFVCRSMIDAGTMSRSMKGQLVPICAYIVMAISLNLTVGISGELSLGHAGFMSIGAFSGIIFAGWLRAVVPDVSNEVRLLLAILVGGVFALAAGFLIGIPVLRLRGDYLAIVTLAFGEIIRSLLNLCYFWLEGTDLRFSFGSSPDPAIKYLFNGPAGAQNVAKIPTETGFIGGFILVLVTLFVVLNLIGSRSGRAIMAARDNRIAAESVGVNITKYKMMAFTVSACLAGMAGALFGLNYSTLQSVKFNVDASIQVLVFVVLGGIGNIWGSIISAALLYVLPEMLRTFSTYRMLIYAIVLIIVMIITNLPLVRGFVTQLSNASERRRMHRDGKIRKGDAV